MGDFLDVAAESEFRSTMELLESAKKVSPNGVDYWLAREICPILGYSWEGFEAVISRATDACDSVEIDSRYHFRQTSNMMKVGKGGQRRGVDYFLSRPACYLIAMNGDPSKRQVAAAQAYFAIQTRRMELHEQLDADKRRLEMRDRVRTSIKKVSGVAKDAGLPNKMQAAFHNARYIGLYNMSYQEVKKKKGLDAKEVLFDRAGALELSANDFQMNLAANVISREAVQGTETVIQVNRTLGERVRGVIAESNGTMPENLPVEPPIAVIKKRVKAQTKEKLRK
jgi:DNA-damage-inducible protein D